MKNTALFILWKLSIILGIVVVLFLIGIQCVNWLHTESGQKFVTNRIAAQLKGTALRLDNLNYTYVSDGMYDVQASGYVQTYPFTAKARVKPQRYTIDIEEIVATLPELEVTGQVNYKYGDSYATGKLTGALASIKPYHKSSVINPLNFKIDLKPESLIEMTASTSSYKNTDIGLALLDINADATFQNSILKIQSFNMKDLKKGTANISGTFNTLTQDTNIVAKVENLDPNIENINGKINGDAQITGKVPNLHIQGKANIKQAQGGTIDASGTIEAVSQEANITITVKNFDPKIASISGKINADVKITGKGQNHTAQGQASLTGDQGGTINAGGTVQLQNQTADIAITARNFDPNIENVKGKIDADITLSGKPDAYLLQGAINPQEMTVTLPDQFATSVQQVNIVKKGEKPAEDITKTLALDLTVNAPRQIYVLGMGLDAEFGGKLKVNGFADDPQVNGELNIIRGRYSEFGKTFKITKANLLFLGSVPPSPELDIVTETQAGEILAKILITGPAQKPKISFSSVPEKPEDEVVSYILFGKDPAELSPIQAVQLARSIAKFSGAIKGGGLDPIVTLRNATGLDDISVETDDEGNVNVGAKKRINDRVTLEVESGSEPDSAGAKIEIELTPSITLESKVGQDASGGAGIFWSRDY